MPLFSPKTRVLVPLELPEPREISPEMIELLGSADILLLGWYEVPDQTSPEQAREQAEDTGESALETVAQKFEDAGADVDVRHVFTPDLMDTIQRIGAEERCEAALISAPIDRLKRLLVVLREDVRAETVGDLLDDLLREERERVTLLQISEDEADEGREWSDRVLEELERRGVDTDRVATRIETSDDPGGRVLDICREEDFDVLIVPERGEMDDRLFGSFAEKLGRESRLPVVVIRGGDRAS
ncbi:MAG: universal stress protein [Longimicrobiales bacterium]|nr:universal stress protein [Longimicrobiales bacterium]